MARKPSVLVVDPSEALRSMVRYALLGRFEVDEAANGLDALGRLHGHRYDCVVVERDLPDMGGCELAWRLRTRAAGGGVAVVLISPAGDPAPREGEGPTHVLTRPFHPQELLDIVSELAGARVEAVRTASLQSVLQSLPDPAMVLDDAHRVWVANTAFYTFTERGADHCYIDCASSMHGPEGMPETCPLEESSVTGRPCEREVDVPGLGRLVVSVFPVNARTPDGYRLYLHLTRLVSRRESEVPAQNDVLALVEALIT